MGPLEDDNGENSSRKRSSLDDHEYTETQPFDSQISTSPFSGEKDTAVEAGELLHCTVPFDDTVAVEDGIEIQKVNFADETQEVDLGCDTQVENLDGETLVEDLDGETQVLYDVDCIDHAGTQLLYVYDDDEVVTNNEDEGTNGTEPLYDNDEPSSDELVGIDGVQSLNEENIQGNSLGLHLTEGLEEPLDPLRDNQTNSGSGQLQYTSFHTASFRANKALKGANSESCSIPSNDKSSNQYSSKNSAASLLKPGERVDQEQIILREDHIVKSARNENSGRLGSSAVRKLFADDSDAGNKESSYDNYRDDKGKDLIELPACDLAGLSYVGSQEPGELSQANALNFVDNFLKDNDLKFGNEDDPPKSTIGDSKHPSSAKGPQRLAKKANEKSIVGEIGIYDWDDSREDERGGDIFCRRKEEFLSGGSHGWRRQKSKAKRLEVQNGANQSGYIKIKSMVGSSGSQVVSHNPADIEVEKTSRKNLVDVSDKQSDIDTLSGELEENVTETGVPPMSDVGFDTQMAAEAMEALCCGEDIAKCHVNDAHKSTQKGSDSSSKASSGGNINILCSNPPPSKKRTCHNDAGFASRQSKKARKIKGNLNIMPLASSGKRPKSIRKQCQKELIMTKMNVKSNGKEHLKISGSKNCEFSVKKGQRQGKVRKLTSIAGRTRRSLVDNASHNCREEMNQLTEVVDEGKSNVTKEVQASKILHLRSSRRSLVDNASHNCREQMNQLTEVVDEGESNVTKEVQASKILNLRSSKMGRAWSGKVEDRKQNQPDHSDKKMASKPNDHEIDALSYPRRRRSARKLSFQVNKSYKVDVPSELFIQSVEDELCISRQKRSCRKTLSSSFAYSVKTPVDQNLVGKLPQQILVSEAAKSVEISTRMDESPSEKSKPSLSSCVTPVSHQVPVSDASPVCMGSEYFKQSCKITESRPSLLKEIRCLSARGSEPDIPSKDLRKRRDMTEVCVLYSQHLDENIVKHQKKILARLGVSVASCIADATHFIADQFVRTRNMLEAIACGKPVVTHLWLESCGQANCFIDEKSYILRDGKKEKEFGFSMPASLARACQHALLKGWRVLVTPNTKPSKETILSLVKAVQGQPVERICRSLLKDGKVPEDLLVLSCEEDYTLCLPFLEKGAAIYSSELLLNGMVTQKLEYERHRIFADDVKKTRTTIWLRKEGNKFLRVSNSK